MLLNLHVKNLAIIDEVEVYFKDRLNIITGETGAGKSIIIGSINIALGGKVSKDMIRKGADYALVELAFHIEDEETIDDVENTTFVFMAKAGSDGRMFGSISTKQVADEIKKVLNIEVDKRKFVDPIPVNAFGTTLLKIDLYKGIIATVKVHVCASNM